MKSQKLLLSVFLISLCAPLPMMAGQINHSECTVPSQAQVKELFNHWNAALQTKDPKQIAALYADDGVLLPTLSNTPHTNHKQLEDYFAFFVKKNPSGKINSQVIRSGCNWATDTGVYTFTFVGKDGAKSDVTARFSYVYEYINGKWLIISHHSSLLPNPEDSKDKEEMSELEGK